MPIAERRDDLRLIVALEAGSWHDVEHSISAVSIFRIVTAALDFEIIDVLGVDLRAQVGGDIGIGYGYAVNEPIDLMAAAHVQHVVGDVCAGSVVGDHRHAVGAVGAGSLGYVLTIDQSGGGYRIQVQRFRLAGDNRSLSQGRDRQLKVKDRRRSGSYCDGPLQGFKFRLTDSDFVVTHRHGGE